MRFPNARSQKLPATTGAAEHQLHPPCAVRTRRRRELCYECRWSGLMESTFVWEPLVMLIGQCVVLLDVGFGFSHLAWSVVEEVIHLGHFLGLESLKKLSGSLVLRYLLELDGLFSGDFKEFPAPCPQYLIFLDSRILKTRTPIVTVPGWNPCHLAVCAWPPLSACWMRGCPRGHSLEAVQRAFPVPPNCHYQRRDCLQEVGLGEHSHRLKL